MVATVESRTRISIDELVEGSVVSGHVTSSGRLILVNRGGAEFDAGYIGVGGQPLGDRWSNAITYTAGDIVGYAGSFWKALSNNSNHAPALFTSIWTRLTGESSADWVERDSFFNGDNLNDSWSFISKVGNPVVSLTSVSGEFETGKQALKISMTAAEQQSFYQREENITRGGETITATVRARLLSANTLARLQAVMFQNDAASPEPGSAGIVTTFSSQGAQALTTSWATYKFTIVTANAKPRALINFNTSSGSAGSIFLIDYVRITRGNDDTVLAEPAITPGTTGQYWRGDKTWQTLDKTAVGLGNVDNTSDAAKPISTAVSTALAGKEPSLAAGTSAQYYRGDKTWQTLDKTAVGLSNVANVLQYSASNLPAFSNITGVNTLAQMPAGGGSTQYMRGDKTWQTLDITAVPGLSSALSDKGSLSADNIWHGHQDFEGSGVVVAGTFELHDWLEVFGDTYLDSAVYVDGNLNVNGDANLNSNAYLSGSLDVIADANIHGVTYTGQIRGGSAYDASLPYYGVHAAAPLSRSAAEYELAYQSMIAIGETSLGSANPAIDLWRTGSGTRSGNGWRTWVSAAGTYSLAFGNGDYDTAPFYDKLTMTSYGDVTVQQSLYAGALYDNGNRVYSAAYPTTIPDTQLPGRAGILLAGSHSYVGSGSYNSITTPGTYAVGGSVTDGAYSTECLLEVDGWDSSWITQRTWIIYGTSTGPNPVMSRQYNDSLGWSAWKPINFDQYEPKYSGGTTGQYYRGDKSWQTLNVAAVTGAADDTTVVHKSGAETITGDKLFVSSGTGVTPLAVKGAVGQSAALQTWQNSGGSAVAIVGPTGNITSYGALDSAGGTLDQGSRVYSANNLPAFSNITGVNTLAQMPASGGSTQYMRGDKTWQTLNVAAISGLNTALAGKEPVIPDSGWNTLSLSSDWDNYLGGGSGYFTDAAVRKIRTEVRQQGLIFVTSTYNPNTVIYTLPSDCLPLATVVLDARIDNLVSKESVEVTIAPNGDVSLDATIPVGGYLSLESMNSFFTD